MAHVRRQQLGVEQEGGGSDQIVGVVDAAVGLAMFARQRAGGSRDVLVDGNPRERREELFERLELVVPNPGEELYTTLCLDRMCARSGR